MLQASHRRGKKRARERKKEHKAITSPRAVSAISSFPCDREALLTIIVLSCAGQGGESLPCTAAEVYSQLTQSCMISRETVLVWTAFGCISQPNQDSGCPPGEWHIPAWWSMKPMLRRTTAHFCSLLKLRGVGVSPVPQSLCPLLGLSPEVCHTA